MKTKMYRVLENSTVDRFFSIIRKKKKLQNWNFMNPEVSFLLALPLSFFLYYCTCKGIWVKDIRNRSITALRKIDIAKMLIKIDKNHSLWLKLLPSSTPRQTQAFILVPNKWFTRISVGASNKNVGKMLNIHTLYTAYTKPILTSTI